MPVPADESAFVELLVPAEDRWVFARLAKIVVERLIKFDDSSDDKQQLFRWLWALQKLPYVQRGISLGLSTGVEIDGHGVSLARDGFSLSRYEEGTTVLQALYAVGRNQCTKALTTVDGPEKREALEQAMNSLEYYVLNSREKLYLAGFSDPLKADDVPLGLS